MNCLKWVPLVLAVFALTPPPLFPQSPLFPQQSETELTVSGLVTSRDRQGLCIRNVSGQFEIQWTPQTEVALQVNTRQFSGLQENLLRYRVHSSDQTIEFPVPEGPVTGIVTLGRGNQAEDARKMAQSENWISERGLQLRFGEQLPARLPAMSDPRFVGLWDPVAKPRTLSINGAKYEISLKKGGQTSALLFNVLTTADCLPFIYRATVVGHQRGKVIIADAIHLLPLGDQTLSDDPELPRYLVIGDSISGNYDRSLRQALRGRFNIHHPPTNCGSSSKGKHSIVEWLGGYGEKGRHWDVISFNFGHWDAGSDRKTYQANLEAIILELKKTGAELIWVSTCPVPGGYPPAGALNAVGQAPRRTCGVMKKYLNPWALEVMRRHPEISICDQWQFVKDHADEAYRQWWSGANVHFGPETSTPLGQLLAKHVKQVTGQ